MCVRGWLCETKLGRSLLSCEARPSMESAIGCRVFVEAVLGVRHWVIGHRLAVFLTRALVRIWRDGEAILFTGNIDPSERRESRLGTVGCVVRLACLAL